MADLLRHTQQTGSIKISMCFLGTSLTPINRGMILSMFKAIQEPQEPAGSLYQESAVGEEVLDIPAVKQKLEIAQHLRERACELEMEAREEHRKYLRRFVRNMEDKELNRTQCLDYLSIRTVKALKEWEDKYSPYGYLQFKEGKIMRSELLRFIDDRQSGKIVRLMESGPERPSCTTINSDRDTGLECPKKIRLHGHIEKLYSEAVT